MTTMEFFGCTLIAFGPPFAMFCLLIAKDPIRIIIMISAAFFWLMSLLLSSILWTVVVPLKDYLSFGVTFSILFQELFRYIFYRVLRKAEPGLSKVSEVGTPSGSTSTNNRTQLAFVSGLGFGIMSGAFSVTNILADSIGPGTVGIYGDSQYFFLCSSFTTLAFILLHTLWGVIFSKACDNRNYVLIAYVLATHFIVSAITFMNQNQWYLISIPLIYTVTALTTVLAFHCAGGSIGSLKRAFSRQ
ncbi:gamma-secretase subunit Aph-1-like [Oppia nitens]|uniref:gamma-secretase subunit Aph-1-like n=1 Tax=Oppia nitens TaxID=1686743 RepID=UPI0023DBCB14|nr:gamma-secretase subunit Aph-1-like [Oppia nitens]